MQCCFEAEGSLLLVGLKGLHLQMCTCKMSTTPASPSLP